MKRSELIQLIKEEVKNALKENSSPPPEVEKLRMAIEQSFGVELTIPTRFNQIDSRLIALNLFDYTNDGMFYLEHAVSDTLKNPEFKGKFIVIDTEADWDKFLEKYPQYEDSVSHDENINIYIK